MNNLQIIFCLFLILLYPLVVYSANFDEILTNAASQDKPFWGNYHKNIKWIKHDPLTTKDDAKEGYNGQADTGIVDLDGDKKNETIVVIWEPGTTDHGLKIEIYKNKEKVDTLNPIYGSQPNFDIEDIDEDGKQEIIMWGGLWDPRLPGEDEITKESYEGHSDPHRYIVAKYKLIKNQYYLWDAYMTKKKYEPFCRKKPEE